MVDLASTKANPIELIREFARSGRELREESLERIVNFINSGKHPQFPGAKQRVTVNDARKAFQALSQAVRDPNSMVNQGLDIVEKRSGKLSENLQSVKKDLEKRTFFSRIKAFFKIIFAQKAFSSGVKNDMKSVVSSPA